MDELIRFKSFLLLQKGQSERTVHTNMKIVQKMLSATPMEKDSLLSYIYSLAEQKRAPSYIKQYIVVIRHWGECFQIPELIQFQTMKIKVQRDPFLKDTLSDEEIDAFLKLPCDKKEPFFIKRYNMWTVFFSIQAWTGMRDGEVARLRAEDIDFGRNVIIIRHTKTNEPRLVPIPPDIKTLLSEYLKELEGSYMFPTTREEKLPYVSWAAWAYQFKERVKRLGIKRQNLTAYSLRHSFITRQLDEDVNLKKVQLIVGHKRIETTAKYTHLSMKSLQRVIDNDRLRSLYQTAKEALQDIRKDIRKLEEKHQEKVLTNITVSDNEDEMVIVFKIRK